MSRIPTISSGILARLVTGATQGGIRAIMTIGRAEIIWAQILQLAPELFELLDDQWRGYLALPLVPTGGGFPEPAAVGNSLRNYDLVATDPKFAELAARPE